jgi:hypothetical protein
MGGITIVKEMTTFCAKKQKMTRICAFIFKKMKNIA